MAPKAPVSGTGKVFFDVDGTLLPTEMPHACLLFILGLPHFWQRLWKLLLFWLVLVPVIIIKCVCFVFCGPADRRHRGLQSVDPPAPQ